MTNQQRQPRFTPAQLDEMKSRVPLSSLVGPSVKLFRQGREFEACCPFHHETTPSFTISDDKGFAHCFGCGWHGDHFDWLREHKGMSFPEAAEYLSRWTGVQADAEIVVHPRYAKRSAENEWKPILPVPADTPSLFAANGTARIYNPKRAGDDKEWTTLRPRMVHAYRSFDGDLLGYVLRCQFDDGGKFTPQVTWCENRSGERRWCLYPFPEPRPLYGMDTLKDRKRRGYALLVEGEKCADRARMLLDLPVLAWPGGTNGVRRVDYTPLAGWKLMVWPDADEPGLKAAEGGWNARRGEVEPGIAQLAMAAGAVGVRIVVTPEGVAKGWDIADAIDGDGWDQARIDTFLRANLRDPREPKPPRPEKISSPAGEAPMPAPEAPPMPEPPPPDDGPDTGQFGHFGPDEDGTVETEHFRALGYDRSHFLFLTARGGQVLPFSGSALKDLGVLMQLAPLQYWEREFPGRNGVATNMAANTLISACYRAGLYSPDRLRGRGAWWDDGQAVLHLGDRIVADGQEFGLLEFTSNYIYERRKAFNPPAAKAISSADANKLLELCCMLSWERVISGYLLAGWCVIAPICGALEWRSSIWLLGPSGTGKGWIIKNIIRKVVGDFALVVEGDTSASGIEQQLRGDARSIIFDEAEAETERNQERMRAIHFLMRVASSSDGGKQYKGTTDGRGRSSQVRTCFAFASTNMAVESSPDESRIAPLVLVRQEDPEDFKRIKETCGQVITPDFSSRMLARSINLIPVIRRNAETFSEAATELFGSRRVGDQLGTLLAGAFSLTSTKEITPDAAKAWLAGKDWSDHTILSAETDEQRFLNHLMQHRVRVVSSNTTYEMTLGELVMAGRGKTTTMMGWQVAEDEIRRYGLRLHEGGIYISTTHTALKRVLKDTPWAAKWRVTLLRLPGAQRADKTVHFGPGAKTPAVWLPLSIIEG